MVRTDKQVYCFNPDGKEWPIEYIIDAGWDLNDDEPKYLCKWLNFHKSFSDWQYEKMSKILLHMMISLENMEDQLNSRIR